MKTYLLHIWESLNSTYWFVPAGMSISAFLLGLALVRLDGTLDAQPRGESYFFFIGGAEGARSLLATVASSIITVAGVVFSITIATLTQASSQFGPRLLRNFMRDTGNQVTLGTFVATFLYCLIVLRSIHGASQDRYDTFVPNISVTVAVALAICSIAVLIYFIHHVSASLQAPIVVANVANDLDVGIERMFPLRVGIDEAKPPELPPDLEQNCRSVTAQRSGYIQAVDPDGIMACDEDEQHVIVRMVRRPGDYVIKGYPLAEIWPVDAVDEALIAKIRGAVFIGRERTNEQDVEYAVDQLVEIAIRAISPAINDPFTAIQCIDWLSEALVKLSGRHFPSPYRVSEKTKRLCVIARVSDVDGVVDAAFNQIRQYGRTSVAVTIRLLEVIGVIAESARSDAWRAALRQHAEQIMAQARIAIEDPCDLGVIQGRFDRARAAIEQSGQPPAKHL